MQNWDAGVRMLGKHVEHRSDCAATMKAQDLAAFFFAGGEHAFENATLGSLIFTVLRRTIEPNFSNESIGTDFVEKKFQRLLMFMRNLRMKADANVNYCTRCTYERLQAVCGSRNRGHREHSNARLCARRQDGPRIVVQVNMTMEVNPLHSAWSR